MRGQRLSKAPQGPPPREESRIHWQRAGAPPSSLCSLPPPGLCLGSVPAQVCARLQPVLSGCSGPSASNSEALPGESQAGAGAATLREDTGGCAGTPGGTQPHGVLGQEGAKVLCCAVRGVGLEEVNYRKLRIGAGNRTNAVVTLGRGCGGAPTAQGGSIQLGHVFLVPLPQPGSGGLRCRTAGSPGPADLWAEVTVTGCRNQTEAGELRQLHCPSLCGARAVSGSRSSPDSGPILAPETYRFHYRILE